MDYLHSPIGGYDEADPRDSDLGELPDASDASIGNVPMFLAAAPFIAIFAGLVLAVVTR